jgi:threonine synthase
VRFHFSCFECQKSYEEDPHLLVCPACTQKQLPGGVTRGVLEVIPDEVPSRWPDAAPGSPDFLLAFLPLASIRRLPPLPIGGTPLLSVPRLRSELAMPRLLVKDDTRNPSGSTKDRASLLVVAKAVEYGFSTIATASTGNAATALAAVAAAAAVTAVVLVPASTPPAKLVQMLSYGARVLPVAGSYDEAFELCLSACNQLGWYNRSTALNPFTIEGKKTLALEIAAAMQPEAPDVVVVPTGDGVIISGVAKGFADLHRAGLIARVPRLLAVQPQGSAAIANALRQGTGSVTPVSGASSIADSLTVESPRNAVMCLDRVRDSGGGGVVVSDEAIVAAIARLARLTGIFAEPAAAAALAGLEVAVEQGMVDRDERAVLVITGTGLKDVEAAARAVKLPEAIAPSLEALMAVEPSSATRRRMG